MKLLLGEHADESATARFRLEAQTAARLSHPHLVAVFDFGSWEDRLFLVMELVEGRSLSDLLLSQERRVRSRSPGSPARRPPDWPRPTGRASSTGTSNRET